MRHGRSKQARRTLQFLQRNADFREPYTVLVDGTFVVAIVRYSLPFAERLDKLLQHARYSLIMLSSSFKELEKIYESTKQEKKDLLEEAIDWAKQNCEIVDPEDSGDTPAKSINVKGLSEASREILQTVASPSTTYFCASQDDDLLDRVRNVTTCAVVPVIRLARGSVLLLEQPSKTAQNQARSQERSKWSVTGSVSQQEQKLVDIVRQKERDDRKQEERAAHPRQPRRRNKARGPNPLSCKKRKDDNQSQSGSRKRRRSKS